jgi:signal peptidase II
MGTLAGGIAGNVIDKMLRGKTIDFIPLPLSSEQTIIFNIADFFQWIGVILIVWKVLTADKDIWFPDNKRGKYLVHPKEQIKFSIKFSAIAFCVSLLLGIFCFTFMRTTLITSGSKSVNEMMGMFSIAYISLTMTFSLIVFLVGLILSHKTAGPLYAFELYVEDLLNGNMRNLSLREGDNYKHLEKVADDLKQHFNK